MAESLSKYGYVRIAVASPEMRVADTGYNSLKIIEAIANSERKKAQFLLFPELSITGYSCSDLFFQDILLTNARKAIDDIKVHIRDKNIIVIVGAPIATNGKIFNCAVVLFKDQILGIIPKTFLCNTKEYYEERWFSSGNDRVTDYIDWNSSVVPFGSDILFVQKNYPTFSFGVEICEDLWSVKPPSFDLALAGAQILFNLSASNEYLKKVDYRRNLVKMQSARCFSAYAFSSCGPNESTTDTVFSGHCLISENGTILTETDRFKFDTQIAFADIDIEKLNNERQLNNTFGGSLPAKNFRMINFEIKELFDKQVLRKLDKSPFVPVNPDKRTETCNEIFSIQTTGLAKRIRHTGVKSLVIGVSGGLDSTLALLAAVETFKLLGKDQKDIISVNMPGFGTTDRTKNNAVNLANELGVTLKNIPINESVKQHFKDIDYNSENYDIVFENAQARERTQILMDLSNMYNGLVLGTGDLSEIALGWNTYNADHISMYNVNSGIPKTLVKYIIDWAAIVKFKDEISRILKDICNMPISPELLPPGKNGEILQQTEETIGPYELHDFFLYYAIRMNYRPQKIIFLAKTAFKGNYSESEITKYIKIFYQRFFQNQFKRSCVPDGIKVGTVSLSPRADWRMPSDASVQQWMNDIDITANDK